MTLNLDVNGQTNDIATNLHPDVVRDWAMQRVEPDNTVDVWNADTGEIYFEAINGKVTLERWPS